MMGKEADNGPEALAALQWLRALCLEGGCVPIDRADSCGPPKDFDAAKFALGQQTASRNLFSLAYAELVSMLMMFAFPDQTMVLVATGRSDTPSKAYTRYLSTMRRVRSWYEGDLWNQESAAARNLKVVRAMHEQAEQRLAQLGVTGSSSGSSLHAQVASGPETVQAAREAFADHRGHMGAAWAEYETGAHAKQPPAPPPALNQRSMALTQVAFVGLFILEPRRFGAHAVTDEELDALVYVWWVLGRALGIRDCFNACVVSDTIEDANNNNSLRDKRTPGAALRMTRARCRAVVGECVFPRLARASAQWHLMASALCDGASLAAPGLSLPVALACLVDVLGAVVECGEGRDPSARSARSSRTWEHPAVERLLSRRQRAWRAVYRAVLERAMRYAPGRALHNALFKLALWVSQCRAPAHNYRARLGLGENCDGGS